MISSLIRALEHWLQIQAIRARWELERDIEYHVQRCESEIVRARRNGDEFYADRVRQQLLRSSGIALPRQPDFAAESRANSPGGDR